MLSFSRLGAARIPSLHGLPDRHIIKTEGPVLPDTRALRCPGSARCVMWRPFQAESAPVKTEHQPARHGWDRQAASSGAIHLS